VQSVGRSKLVPYLKKETGAQRHERRKREAITAEHLLRQDLEKLGLTLRVSNEGHHWKMTRPGLIVEWWPSTAKLVFNKAYRGGIHCHDRFQVIGLICARRLEEKQKKNESDYCPPVGRADVSTECPF
jgi:hypothetical protein